MSSGGSDVVGPGGVLAAEGGGLEAAVQDADESVGYLSEGGLVADAAARMVL
jgi:hypothetical protein